jgi:Flp pilus assembly protein TadD
MLVIGLLAFYSSITVQNNRYWRTPLVFFERLIKQAPDSARAHIELGLIYSTLGRGEEAVALMKKAIEIKPTYAEAYNSLAAVYDQLGRKEEALAMFQKAIEVDPKYPRAYNNLAIFYFYQQNFPLAIEYCDQAKALGYADPSLENLLRPYRATRKDEKL